MGTEKGFQFAKEHQLSVLFLDVIDEQTIVEHATGEFLVEVPLSAKSSSGNSISENWISFVAALAVFLLAVTGMSIGVLAKNRELKGSCGGLASMAGQGGESECELCTIPGDQCTNPDVKKRLQKEAADSGEV